MPHAILESLYNGNALDQAQAYQLFQHIMHGELNNEQLAGALIAIRTRGIALDELIGAVTATLDNAEAFPAVDYPFADIVGTGGDGANTINISTTTALVISAMGYPVAKHGSRSVSSKTGASDVLSALGIQVDMAAETAKRALDEIGLCFLFAPKYHLGFKHAAPVRQALKTRTLFNILGPLVNPACPKRQLLGVYSADLISLYAETARALGHSHSMVIYGEGLDEVGLHGTTEVAEIQNGEITRFTLTAADFGLPAHPLSALRGGEPAENAEKVRAILAGNGEAAHVDAVAANGALLMRLFGETDLKANVAKIKAFLATGEALAQLEKLQTYA